MTPVRRYSFFDCQNVKATATVNLPPHLSLEENSKCPSLIPAGLPLRKQPLFSMLRALTFAVF